MVTAIAGAERLPATIACSRDEGIRKTAGMPSSPARRASSATVAISSGACAGDSSTAP
jgi:hypothetical protein